MTLPDFFTALPPIPTEWISQGGAVGLLAFVALLIFLGRLVPSSTYKQLERDRDYWREAALKAIGHADTLMPGAQIAVEVTRALGQANATNGSVEQAVEQALGGASPPNRQVS